MKKILIAIVVVIIIIIALVSNQKDTPEGKVKVAVMAPLSGFLADYGEEIRKGVLAAKSDNVEFVFEDDKCDAKEAFSVWRKLVEIDGINIIVGPGCGAPQEAVAPLAKEKNVVLLAPSAASQSLYEISGGNFFNLQYGLENESKFIAEKMYEKGYRNVVLIGYQNAFSKVHEDSFKANFKGTIVKHLSFASDTSDVSTDISKLKGENIDAIFSTDITFLFAHGLEKLKLYGINVPVYTQYAAELPAVRELAEGVIYSFPADIDDKQGAVANLSKQAAEIANEVVGECGNDTDCIKKELLKSGDFDEKGISTRQIILKTIKDGQPVAIEQ